MVGIEAVPVFPAAWNPGTSVPRVSPFSAERWSICSIVAAAGRPMACRMICGRVSDTTRPVLGSMTALTTCGRIMMPPFAIADIAVAIWIGVTAMP